MKSSVTKQLVDFNCFLLVKNMSEKDLERDRITVNATIYCEIPLQLDNKKFIYKPITTIYRVSHEKKMIQPSFSKMSSMKTMILVLKEC